MRPVKTTIGGAVLAAAFLVTGSARAYVLDEDGKGHPLHWERATVEYRLVRSNTPEGADGEDAVHDAFRTWTEASPEIAFRFEGFVEERTRHNDGRNVVHWIHDDWPYDPTLIASTFRTFDTSDGALIDADVVMNADGARWSVGGFFSYDIENTVAHEVGHAAGLGHSSDSRATMAQGTSHGETKKRTLAEDDVAGLDALYPREGDRTAGLVTGAGAGGSGGCAVVPGAPARAGETAWLAGLLAMLGFAARRSLRSVD